jgi:hypothetical protein
MTQVQDQSSEARKALTLPVHSLALVLLGLDYRQLLLLVEAFEELIREHHLE